MTEPYKVKEIDINKLLVNLENPRYEVLGNQREALQAVVKEQGEKLLNLAKDIANRGTNPFDLVAVTPYEGTDDEGTDERFIVLEGNRRVTAIKLLLEIALVDTLIDTPKLKKQFKDVSKSVSLENIHTQTCVVFAEASLADEWIKLKHTGQNQGIGTVPWDAKAIARFNERFGRKSIALQALDLFRGSIELDEQLSGELSKLSITNLSRLLNDPDIRQAIGISTDDDGTILLMFPKEEVLKPLKKIIFDLIGRNPTKMRLKVNAIYHKNDRINYIGGFEKDDLPSPEEVGGDDSFLENEDVNSSPKTSQGKNRRVERRNDGEGDTGTGSVSAPPEESQDSTEKHRDIKEKKSSPKGKVSQRLSSGRKYLVPTNFILKIDSKRINAIYRELRTLPVKGFTNAVAVLFRVFIESSVDYYIEKCSVPKSAKSQKEGSRYKLTSKIRNCSTRLKERLT